MRTVTQPIFAAYGAALSTHYLEGPTVHLGRPQRLRAQLQITAATDSQLGQVTIKWQGTLLPPEADRWADLASVRDDTGVLELEHTYLVPPAQQSSPMVALDVRGLRAARLLIRAAGKGRLGDEVLADATVW